MTILVFIYRSLTPLPLALRKFILPVNHFVTRLLYPVTIFLDTFVFIQVLVEYYKDPPRFNFVIVLILL
jgi:hypothetical protein